MPMMTTLDTLERLAKAATQAEPSDHGLLSSVKVQIWQDALDELCAALTPERVLALIACVRAADAMAEQFGDQDEDYTVLANFEAARAKLEEVWPSEQEQEKWGL